MPILGSRGAGSAKGFGFSNVGKYLPYWAVGYSPNVVGQVITTQQTSASNLTFAKLATSPELVYAKQLTFSGYSANRASASTTYTCVLYRASPGNAIICFNNSDGSINWQKTFPDAIGDSTVFLYSDTVGYYVGRDTGDSFKTNIVKFNPTTGSIITSVTTTSSTQLFDGFNSAPINAVADSSYLYFQRYTYSNNGTAPFQRYGAEIVKINAALNAVSWSRVYSENTVGNQGLWNNITVDASGNVYIAGSGGDSSSIFRTYIVKYNSSGTYQSTISITGANFYPNKDALAVDSSYLYFFGSVDSTEDPSLVRVNLSSFTAVPSATRFSTGITDAGGRGVAVLSTGQLFFGATGASPTVSLSMYMPSDLSTIYGTYSNGYSTTVLTLAASTPTFGSFALARTDNTTTVAALSFTPTTTSATIADVSASISSLYQMKPL